ncbi:protein of unknown function [Bradyrhizobium sp. ORS 285]|nr:protein of unknown function [Bradyrhizobium sp. ORS 285]
MLMRSQSARCCGERSRKDVGVSDSFVIRSQGVPKLKLRAYMRHNVRQGEERSLSVTTTNPASIAPDPRACNAGFETQI